MKSNAALLLIFLCLSCNLGTSAFKEGAFLYQTHCASCHGSHAEGLGQWYPPLKDTSYLNSRRSEIPAWIRYGINRDSGSRFHGRINQTDMPENSFLKPADISNILNYLNDTYWKQKPFDLEEVETSLKWARNL